MLDIGTVSTHYKEHVEFVNRSGMFSNSSQRVYSRLEMTTVNKYLKYLILYDRSVVLIGEYSVHRNACWIDICREKDVHLGKAINISVLVRGPHQLDAKYFTNVVQMEVENFDLVDAIVDLLIIVLIKVYALDRKCFACILGQGRMNRLGVAAIRYTLGIGQK